MAVSAGRYRHRIRILKNSGERDEYGGQLETRVEVSKPWCKVRTLADNEIVGTTTEGQQMTEFEVRFSKSLEYNLNTPNSEMFIEFKGSEFDITSVINYLELNEKLLITAIKR